MCDREVPGAVCPALEVVCTARKGVHPTPTGACRRNVALSLSHCHTVTSVCRRTDRHCDLVRDHGIFFLLRCHENLRVQSVRSVRGGLIFRNPGPSLKVHHDRGDVRAVSEAHVSNFTVGINLRYYQACQGARSQCQGISLFRQQLVTKEQREGWITRSRSRSRSRSQSPGHGRDVLVPLL
jgi:hypothetical protein